MMSHNRFQLIPAEWKSEWVHYTFIEWLWIWCCYDNIRMNNIQSLCSLQRESTCQPPFLPLLVEMVIYLTWSLSHKHIHFKPPIPVLILFFFNFFFHILSFFLQLLPNYHREIYFPSLRKTTLMSITGSTSNCTFIKIKWTLKKITITILLIVNNY